MTGSDELAIEELLRRWISLRPADAASVTKVKIMSPTVDNVERGIVVRVFGRELEFKTFSWDLNSGPCHELGKLDLIVSCNCFMAAYDPLLWLTNCGKTAPYLLMQDCVRAWRDGRNGENAIDDGDLTRYSFSLRGELARPEASSFYDMSAHDEFIDDVIFYDDRPAPNGKDARKFVAMIRVSDLVKSLQKPKKLKKRGDAIE